MKLLRVATGAGILWLSLFFSFLQSPARAQVFTNATKLHGMAICSSITGAVDGVALVWNGTTHCWDRQSAPGAGATGPAGANGQDVTVAIESPGSNCTTGGIKTVSVSGTRYVCNGAAGANGSNGTNGTNGTSPTVTAESSGVNCTYGGVKIVATSTYYVCNGAPGSGGGGGGGGLPATGPSGGLDTSSGTYIDIVDGVVAFNALPETITGFWSFMLAGRTAPFAKLSSAPTSPTEGEAYYDTVAHAPKYRDNTGWQTFGGGGASIPVYNISGSALSTPKIVYISGTWSGGVQTITLTGSAIFTSLPTCTATYTGPSSLPTANAYAINYSPTESTTSSLFFWTYGAGGTGPWNGICIGH